MGEHVSICLQAWLIPSKGLPRPFLERTTA
jgi:hypothetical protein